MDFEATGEQRELRSVVAAIAGRFGGRYYAERAAAHEPCSELWSALGEAGFIGVNVPEAYGGGGGGLVELAMVCEYGTERQRKEWLPTLANGTSKVVFAITEPDAGSNTHKLATTAGREGGDWILRGTKHYISGVDEADAVLVVARSGRGDADTTRLSLFIVPTDAPGLVRTPLPVDAMLPERQLTLFFDDVRLGPGALVGEEGQGFPAGLPRAEPRADHQRGPVRRHRPLRAGPGGAVRHDPHRVGRAARDAPGRRAPAGRGQDRDGARRAHDTEGGLAARSRAARR